MLLCVDRRGQCTSWVKSSMPSLPSSLQPIYLLAVWLSGETVWPLSPLHCSVCPSVCLSGSCGLSIAPMGLDKHYWHAFPIRPHHRHNWYHLTVALWQRKSNRLNDKQISLQGHKYLANEKHLDAHWRKCFRCHVFATRCPSILQCTAVNAD